MFYVYLNKIEYETLGYFNYVGIKYAVISNQTISNNVFSVKKKCMNKNIDIKSTCKQTLLIELYKKKQWSDNHQINIF